MQTDDLFEFMKVKTSSEVTTIKLNILRNELEICKAKAFALRDEPLLEVDQRNLVNEICDKLSAIERLL